MSHGSLKKSQEVDVRLRFNERAKLCNPFPILLLKAFGVMINSKTDVHSTSAWTVPFNISKWLEHLMSPAKDYICKVLPKNCFDRSFRDRYTCIVLSYQALFNYILQHEG